MTHDAYLTLAKANCRVRVALVGDFCLDRYLEIDSSRNERSIETGLEVFNVTRVRSQPGAAGTILNNLIALGVGCIYPIGFCGDDGEGYELRRALTSQPGVDLSHFIQAADVRTFTYTKPLMMTNGSPPRELNRLDIKNWEPTPPPIRQRLIDGLQKVFGEVDAVILLDQVDIPNTGVITSELLAAVGELAQSNRSKLVLGDSRSRVGGFPKISLKVNRAELGQALARGSNVTLEEIKKGATELARRNGRDVFVTLSEDGIIGARPSGEVHHVPAWPLRGPIDVVGAGDAVTANLVTALRAGAEFGDALTIAMAASSIVVHQVGSTGAAQPEEIARLLR